jgi:hypothetical protein
MSEAQRVDRGRHDAMAFNQRKWGQYDAVDVTLTLSAEHLVERYGMALQRAAEICRAAEPEVRERAADFMPEAHEAAVYGAELENWVAGAIDVAREIQRESDQPASSMQRLVGFCYRAGEKLGALPLWQMDLQPFETRSNFLTALQFNVARGAMLMFVRGKVESDELYRSVCASAGVEPIDLK